MKKNKANLDAAYSHKELKAWAKNINDSNYKLNDEYFKMAGVLRQAKEQCEDQAFVELLKMIAMTPNTASRHINNAKCPRLKKYRTELRHITSWGTLNEIRKLSDAEFERFRTKYLAGEKTMIIERRHVFSIKQRAERGTDTFKDKSVEFAFDVRHEDFSAEKVMPLIMAMREVKKLPWVKIKMPVNIEMLLEELSTKNDNSAKSIVDGSCVNEVMKV